MNYKHVFVYAWLALSFTDCGGDSNVADCEKGKKQVPCSARTADENARLALDQRDYATAIELLQQLVDDDPETYSRYPLLSAAYAGSVGISILDLASAQFSGGGTLIDQIASFLPDPADFGDDALYKAALVTLNHAVTTLKAIPADKVGLTSEEKYAASATLQLTLYQSAYSVMYLNQFTISATTGQVDLDKLANMTEDDAVVIIQSLAAAGALTQGVEGEALQAKVNEALAAIQGEDGASNLAKLQGFIRAEQAGAAGATGATGTTGTAIPQ